MNNYEKEVVDTDQILNTDIKLNPDFYIHNAIVKAQQALISEDLRSGLIQFRVLIEHVESLCRAGRLTDDSYDESIEEYKRSEEYSAEDDALIKKAKIANKKLELLMTEIFDNKTLTGHLKV